MNGLKNITRNGWGTTMKYGIIGAMDEEISYLLREMTDKRQYKIANSLFIEGKIATVDVVILKSGIGKVNAAMATTILLEKFQPSYVINTGSAGGFADDLSVGDIVISKEVVHHDVDATGFGYSYGQVPQMPETFLADEQLIARAHQAAEALDLHSKTGLIATGDSFMDNPEKIAEIKAIFPEMLAVEMEGAAIAQVCFQYEIPFVIIRALSDIAGKDSPISFEQFLKKAAKNATELMLTMIEQENS